MHELSQNKGVLIGKLDININDIFLCDNDSRIIILCDKIENLNNDNLVIIENWEIFDDIDVNGNGPFVIANTIIPVQRIMKGIV